MSVLHQPFFNVEKQVLVYQQLKRENKKENTFYANALTTYWRRLSSPSRRQNPAVPICFQHLPTKIKLHGNHLNEVTEAVLYRGAVYYAVQDGSNFCVSG